MLRKGEFAMRIGVVADTHMPRHGRMLPEALLEGLSGVDLIVHLGDFTGPEVVAWFEAIAPLEAVAGNNDPASLVERFGRCKVLTLEGVRIGLVHGDGTRKTTLDRALEAFEPGTVDVVCFGHSHAPYLARHGDRWALNPGSPTDKRRSPRFSYAILEVQAGRVSPALCFYDR